MLYNKRFMIYEVFEFDKISAICYAGIMTIVFDRRQLKILVQESVREAFRAELMKLFAKAVPLVSPQEQKEIERLYKKPTRKAVATRTFSL